MLKGYKTIIVNVAVIVLMGVSMLNPGAEVPSVEDVGAIVDSADTLVNDAVALWTTALATANLVLRAVTSSPIFNRKKE